MYKKNFIANKNNTPEYNLIEHINKITKIGKIIITQKRNNFIASVTNINGDVLFSESPGTVGYKKSNRKNMMTYKEVIRILSLKISKETDLKYFQLIFKGICKGKRIVLNTLMASNIQLITIISEVFYPKNGCRPKKQRRL